MKPSAGDTTTEPANYDAYAQFIKEELGAQDVRKASLEQRAVTVITTSGTLATLLLGLAALAAKSTSTFALPSTARTWVIAALFAFFASAVAALAANAPLSYQAVTVAEIKSRLREDPPKAGSEAVKDIAFTRLTTLQSAKSKNRFKAWALTIAIAGEALAIGFLALAVLEVL